MTKRSAFLKGILGDEGAEALEKSINKVPGLDKVILPYAVSSWIRNIGEYEGQVPGIAKSQFEFAKSEDGHYVGHLNIADFNYQFEKSTLPELVAVFGMVFDIENYNLSDQLKKVNLNQLNKNIDSLVKFKIEQFSIPEEVIQKHDPHFYTIRSSSKHGKYEIENNAGQHILHFTHKNETKGRSLGIYPDLKSAQNAAMDHHRSIERGEANRENRYGSKITKTEPSNSKTSKPVQLHIKKSELYNSCDSCGRPEFEKGNFIGCLCLKDLAKNELIVKEDKNGYTLTFGKGWEENEDSISTLLSILKPKS